jgi:NhaP-type Na+/H+ or K+/H+ antiporter
MVVLKTAVLPTWFGWAGLVVAAVQLICPATFAHSGKLMPQGDNTAVFAAAATLLLWRLATSILMLGPTAATHAQRQPRLGRRRP